MSLALGIDTGGTFTDAVLLDTQSQHVVSKAKALTTRPNLALGIAEAIDRVLNDGGVSASQVVSVSLSTTLATNALVENQGDAIALFLVGFDETDAQRSGLAEAVGDDPSYFIDGGHTHAGEPSCALDTSKVDDLLVDLPAHVQAIAVAGRFATRNPAHEVELKARIQAKTGLPVTCSHEVASALGGPKRALTAVLNARLVGMITRLINAVSEHLDQCGINAPLTVVKGDGALVSGEFAQNFPIETILSGPAASIVGASWLTGAKSGVVSDIGGTTTDICWLKDGRPQIDAKGALVGGHRTMVQAVAMQTWGLGGDSEVSVKSGLRGDIQLGPRRAVPISLLALQAPQLVDDTLARVKAQTAINIDMLKFVVPIFSTVPGGQNPRAQAIFDRLDGQPRRLNEVAPTRPDVQALKGLVARGYLRMATITPSDALHVTGQQSTWDTNAAQLALTQFARLRSGDGTKLADNAEALAHQIVEALQAATRDYVLQTAFVHDGHRWTDPAELAHHALTRAGLGGHRGLLAIDVALNEPLIGLGASAKCYYPALSRLLNTDVEVPDHADVANAIGAVVARVEHAVEIEITSPSQGRFLVHLLDQPQSFIDENEALQRAESEARDSVAVLMKDHGIDGFEITVLSTENRADIEGQSILIDAKVKAIAVGRSAIATL